MQITIDIPENVVAKAAAHGLSPESYAVQQIVEAAAREDVTAEHKSFQDFLRQIGKSDRPLPVLPDSALTREAIYAEPD